MGRLRQSSHYCFHAGMGFILSSSTVSIGQTAIVDVPPELVEHVGMKLFPASGTTIVTKYCHNWNPRGSDSMNKNMKTGNNRIISTRCDHCCSHDSLLAEKLPFVGYKVHASPSSIRHRYFNLHKAPNKSFLTDTYQTRPHHKSPEHQKGS